MNNGIRVEVSHDSMLEFRFGDDTNVAENGATSLEKKPSTRLSQQPCFSV
jgi:hypothetical protein